jgi:HD superfamily phosphohydrolase YqeK
MTDNDSTILKKLDELVRQTFSLWDEVWVGFYWRHYFYNHTQRVKVLSLDLGRQENADLEKLEYAALLHDITKRYDGRIITDNQGKRILDARGLWRNEVLVPTRENIVTKLYQKYNQYSKLHNESGAIIVKRILESQGLPKDFCNSISRIIGGHLKPKTSIAESAPDILETKILFDADTIDANIGLPAFYRNIQIRTHFALTENRNSDLEQYLEQYLNGVHSWIYRKPSFIDKMTTSSGSRRAQHRYQVMKDYYEKLLEDLNNFFSPSVKYGLLGIIHYFMVNNPDPNLKDELNHLLSRWIPKQRIIVERNTMYKEVFQRAVNFCHVLSREIDGAS